MKRLLAYLFVVISLGLTFSVSAETDKNGKQISYCKKINNYYDWYGIVNGQNCDTRYPAKISSSAWIKEQLDRHIKQLDNPANKKNRKTKIINFLNTMHAELNTREIDSSIIDNVLSEYPEINSIYSKRKIYVKKDTFKKNFEVEKIIKKKISLLFCKNSKSNERNSLLNLDYYKDCPYWAGKQITYTDWASDILKSKNVCIKDRGRERWAMLTNHSCHLFNAYEAKYNGINFDYDYPIKKIAKAEPSQTQKVVELNQEQINFSDTVWRTTDDDDGDIKEIEFHNNGKCAYKNIKSALGNQGKYYSVNNGNCRWTQSGNKITYNFNNNYSVRVASTKNQSSILGTYTTKKRKGGVFKFKGELIGYIENGIVKKELTIKPKKKVKVAKVEDSTQEEFKPKKTNQDNEAPVITIAEAITVDSQAYTLKGKVKDKSQVYLTIDGRQVDVKKGKFKLDRFNIDPDVAENIKIVAIDKWNNRTEKTIKVTIDLQSTDVAKVYEQLKPNNIKVKTDKNKIAIIIGIEKYENLTNLDAKYANRDAKAFRTYATRALGIKPSNIKVLIDDKANRGNTLEAFKIWLPKIAGKGGKDIHIFFAGHGLASENGKDLYILPQDGNAKLLDDTAITRVELITLIQKVNPKSVTMFFDTCYSGQTRDERMLVASLLRPIQIISEEQDTPDNFTIFSASNYDQVSGGIEEAQHGMFSYYLMKGLEGNADENKDKKITNGELIAYLKDNVSEEAFTQNREQDPMLAGDPDKVLMSYR